MNGEIISLQFGNYSNFVGTQFFNLQNPNEQETDTNVDYGVWWQERRQGTSKLYSPRLVAVDFGENCVLKGLNPGLGQTAAVAKNNAELWEGTVEEINVGPDGDAPVQNSSGGLVEPRKFQDGRDGWTDLCRWRIPHGQIQMIPNFNHNPEKKGLSSYSQGLEIWKVMEENLSDQIRKYAEVCDHLQGFHVLVDQDDGISGVCGGFLQHLSDEYESKCCFGIGVSPPHLHFSGSKDTNFRNKVANVALLWNRFSHHATAFSSMSLSSNIFSVQSRPRNIPLWRYKAESAYESSSVLAATLENIWAPISTNTSAGTTLPEVSSFLSTFGRKMASICSSFPFPCDIRNDSLFGILNERGLASHLSLTTCLSNLNFEKASGNFYVLKGFPDEIAITEKERAGLKSWQQSMIKDINSCFTVFAQDSYSKSVNLVRSVKNATRVKYPFPANAIIPSALEWNYVKRNYTKGVLDVWDLPCIASAHNTSQNGIVLESAVREVGGDNTRKVHSFHTACNMDIELDDFVQCVEDLSTLKEHYEEKYE